MGIYHPEVVHFAIALLVVGVLARVVSFAGRPAFVGPMAATLIVLGTIAAAAAVQTGELAHGPIEQMPGLRPAVEAHEEAAERAQNLFIVVALIELLALGAARSRFVPYVRPIYALSAIIGLVGLLLLYQAGERGGRIVYGYAGGIGTRSGDPADVQHLALAALYQQGLTARKRGDAAAAAAHFADAADRFRDNVDVQLAAAESQMLDRRDPQAALERLRRISPPADNRAQRMRHGMLLADALDATGQRDAAVATLRQLQAAFPNNPRIKQRLEQPARQ